MEKSQFRLVVQEAEVLERPYVSATGVVEGGSISVDDYVCLTNPEGKRIKVRVESILVAPRLEIRAAEPGRIVRLRLRGHKAKEIQQGDILVPPAKGPRRASTTTEMFLIIFGTPVVCYLLYLGGGLLLGFHDEDFDFLRQMVSLGVVYLVLFSGALIWDVLSKRKWRRKQQWDDWNADFRVLKCSPYAYFLVIAPVLLTVLTSMFFYQWAVDEPQTIRELWESGELAKDLLILIGLDLFCMGNFLHSNWRKVFYSQRLFRLTAFGRSEDIPWTQFHSITLVRKKEKSRLILTTAERSITLRSEVLSYWWGDFVDFAWRMAEEYRIPFETRQEKR